MSIKPTTVCVWSITYSETINNVLPDASILKKAFDNLDPSGYVFQLEKGEEEGRLHFQCNLRLKEKMSQTDLRERLKSILRDYYGAGCMTLRPTSNLKKAEFYCMKDETRVSGPWLFPSNTYIGQDLITEWYPWQKSIFDLVMKPPHDRKIILICDCGGNKGKSLLAKTLGYRHGACVIPLGLSSSQMKSAIVDAGPNEIYLLDLPRNNKSFQDIFDTIEELKRGFVISSFHGKLKSLYMSRPHIVCFTNDWPNLSLLSFDMWDLYTISIDLELEHVDKFGIQRHQLQNKKKKESIPIISSMVEF